MGNSPSSNAPGAGFQDLQLYNVPDLVQEEKLGAGTIMKTLKCTRLKGSVVLKVFLKRDFDPEQIQKSLTYFKTVRATLGSHRIAPGVMMMQVAEETERAIYLVRQYVCSNLDDRYHLHPFLTPLEKRWLAFQILSGLTQLHGASIVHGDLSPQNIVLTSWNWLFLTDINVTKPTFLPSNNPRDYSFYFSSGIDRRNCYLAPERFRETKFTNAQLSKMKCAGVDGFLTEAMDIFSAGCVIAEIFLEGHSLFDLETLLLYREGKFDPASVLCKISDKYVRALVLHMIQLKPDDRMSAHDYLHYWKGHTFPEAFWGAYRFQSALLFPEMNDPDVKLQATLAFLNPKLGEHAEEDHNTHKMIHELMKERRGYEAAERTSAKCIEQLSKFLKSLEFDTFLTTLPTPTTGTHNATDPDQSASAPKNPLNDKRAKADKKFIEVLPLYLAVICSTVQSIRYSSTRAKALVLLGSLAQFVDSQEIVGRIIPYLVSCFHDKSAIVRAQAVRSVAFALLQVSTIPPKEAQIYQEYLFPLLSPLAADEEESVRTELALKIVDICTAARRALDTFPLAPIEDDKKEGEEDESYDILLNRIQKWLLKTVFNLLSLNLLSVGGTHISLTVVMQQLPRMAQFLHREYFLDEMIPHICKILNTWGWEVKSEFLKALPKCLAYIDIKAIKRLILPLFKRACVEHTMVAISAIGAMGSVLHTFKHHCAKELFQMVDSVAPLLCHPSHTLRRLVVMYLVSLADQLGKPRALCFLVPLLSPFLKETIYDVTRESLLHAQKAPLNQEDYEFAVCMSIRENLFEPEKLYRGLGGKEAHGWRTSQLGSLASAYAESVVLLSAVVEDELDEVLEDDSKSDESESFCPDSSMRSTLKRKETTNFGSTQWTKSNSVIKFLVDAELRKPMLWHIIKVAHLRQISAAKDERVLANLTDGTPPSLHKYEKLSEKGSMIRVILHGDDDEAARQTLNNIRTERALEGAMLDVGLVTPNEDNEKRASLRSSSGSVQSILIDRDSDDEDVSPVLTSVSSSVRSKRGRIVTERPLDSLDDLRVSRFQSDAREAPRLSKPGGRTTSASGIHTSRTNSIKDSQKTTKRTKRGSLVVSLNSGAGPVKSGGNSGQRDKKTKGGRTLTAHIMENFNNFASSRKSPFHGSLSMQLREQVPRYISRALKVPMKPPNLGFPSPIDATHVRKEALKAFRPRGKVIKTLTEHNGAVNALAVSLDNQFFVSGGEDGTIKVWKLSGIEHRVNKSTLSLEQNAPVHALTMCEDSHSIVASSTDGWLTVNRINHSAKLSAPRNLAAPRGSELFPISKSVLLKQRVKNGYATSVQYCDYLVLYGTTKGTVHAWDLRARNEAYSFTLPPRLGHVTKTVFGNCIHAVVAGTSQGNISIWDSRFLLPVSSWQGASCTSVQSLETIASSTVLSKRSDLRHRKGSQLMFASFAGTNGMSAYDIVNGSHRMHLQCHTPQKTTGLLGLQANDMLALRSLRICKPTSVLDSSFSLQQQLPTRYTNTVMCTHITKGLSMITGGTDRKLRFWDLHDLSNSFAISPHWDKMDACSAKEKEQHPSYEVRMRKGTVLCEETCPVSKPRIDECAHDGTIRDVKIVESEMPLLISASEDSTVRLWV